MCEPPSRQVRHGVNQNQIGAKTMNLQLQRDLTRIGCPSRQLGIVGIVAMLLAAFVSAIGCGSNDGRLPVSGTVTIDGAPLDGGAINFQPLPGSGGHSSGGSVQGGKFRIPADRGLPPGDYRITIVAMKETGRTINDPQKGPTAELVQVRFRQPPGEVTVAEGTKNEFQIELESAP